MSCVVPCPFPKFKNCLLLDDIPIKSSRPSIHPSAGQVQSISQVVGRYTLTIRRRRTQSGRLASVLRPGTLYRFHSFGNFSPGHHTRLDLELVRSSTTSHPQSLGRETPVRFGWKRERERERERESVAQTLVHPVDINGQRRNVDTHNPSPATSTWPSVFFFISWLASLQHHLHRY
jgi:hypothetical protein